MRLLKLAVIGAGRLGRIHAQKLCRLPGVELAGVVDPVPASRESLATELDVPGFADYRELFGRADAAVLAAPTLQHHEIGMTCLQHGLHLLIEKPLASTGEQASQLVDAARRQSLVLQVGHVERFNPAFAAALPYVGSPRFISAERWGEFSGRSLDIGVVLDLMIHDLDLVLSLVRSPVVRVEATGAPILGQHEDIAEARVTFATGCVANLSASRVSWQARRGMHVWCEQGFASIDFAARTATAVSPNDELASRQFRVEELPLASQLTLKDRLFNDLLLRQELAVTPADAIEAELRDFTESIVKLRSPRVTGEHGRDAILLAENILGSISSNSVGVVAPLAADVPPRVVPAPHWNLKPAVRPVDRRQAG